MGSKHHPALSSLSWLFGVWESVEAVVAYPTMDTVKYCEVMEYQPTEQPYLDYKSETWHSEKKTKLHCEKGYLTVDPDSSKIAFHVSHHFGITELSEGVVDEECLNLESTSISHMSFSKVVATVKIVRKLELKGDELYSTVLLQTANQPLQNHLHSRFRKRK